VIIISVDASHGRNQLISDNVTLMVRRGAVAIRPMNLNVERIPVTPTASLARLLQLDYATPCSVHPPVLPVIGIGILGCAKTFARRIAPFAISRLACASLAPPGIMDQCAKIPAARLAPRALQGLRKTGTALLAQPGSMERCAKILAARLVRRAAQGLRQTGTALVARTGRMDQCAKIAARLAPIAA